MRTRGFAKPVDVELLRDLASEHDIIATLEDGAMGGFAAGIVLGGMVPIVLTSRADSAAARLASAALALIATCEK